MRLRHCRVSSRSAVESAFETFSPRTLYICATLARAAMAAASRTLQLGPSW